MQKNETGKKLHVCSEFLENFKANRGQTFLIVPMDHSVKLLNNFFSAFPSLFLQCTFWPVSVEAEFDDQPLAWKCCLKWYKTVQWALCLVFLDDFDLPWDARNTICLALIGYFSQNMGLIPGRFWFPHFFFYNFLKFWFQTFLRISQDLLVFWKKLWKHIL